MTFTVKLPPFEVALQVILAHLLRTEDASQAEEHREPADRAMHKGEGTPLHSRAA